MKKYIPKTFLVFCQRAAYIAKLINYCINPLRTYSTKYKENRKKLLKSKIEEIKLFLFLYTSSISSKLDRGILRFYIRSLSASVLVPTRCTRSSFYRMERIEDDIDTKNHQIISIRNTAQYIIFIQKHFSFFNCLSIIYIELKKYR